MWPFCRVGAFWMTAITSHAAWLEKSERNVFRYNKVYFYNFLFTLFASLVCRTFRSQSRLGSRRKSNLFPFVGPPLMTSFDVAARLARSCKTVMAVNSGVYEFITVVGMEFFFIVGPCAAGQDWCSGPPEHVWLFLFGSAGKKRYVAVALTSRFWTEIKSTDNLRNRRNVKMISQRTSEHVVHSCMLKQITKSIF